MDAELAYGGYVELMTFTIQRAAQEALAVQDAVNLSGVLATFSTIVSRTLWPEAHRLSKGTEWVNAHPICTVFLDKLCDLNGYNSIKDSEAYDECKRLAEGGE